MRRSYISVEGIAEDPDALAVIGYPHATARAKSERVHELAGLGIEAVSFSGPVLLGRTSVLGKGYVGVAVLGRDARKRRLAVKIRRTDSPRAHMGDEAGLLEAANMAGVGPRLAGYSQNFMVMEYADGERIGRWLRGLGGAGATSRLRRAARSILTDCYRLDKAGIDHGELSNISKHVIISARDHPVLIDFESASTSRRPANVTSMTQAIFIAPPMAGRVRRICGSLPPKDIIISCLREYKRKRDRRAFDALLGVLRLDGGGDGGGTGRI